MSVRMFLLALGWKTTNLYESEAARAVRSYLVWLIFPTMLTLLVLWCIGFLLTLHVVYGFYFALCAFVGCAFLVHFSPLQHSLHEKLEKTFMLDVYLTQVAAAIAKKYHIGSVVPVYIAALGGPNASLIAHFGKPAIVIDYALAHRYGRRSLSGIVCHELGHLVLPLGRNFFYAITFLQFSVDELLYHAHAQILRQKTVPSVLGALRTLAWETCARLAWYASSYPGSHRREYACDALAALLLRDAVPLLVALACMGEDIAQNTCSLSAHPKWQSRIDALRAIDFAASPSRTY